MTKPVEEKTFKLSEVPTRESFMPSAFKQEYGRDYDGELVAKWKELGVVPFDEYEEMMEKLNTQADTYHTNANEARIERDLLRDILLEVLKGKNRE